MSWYKEFFDKWYLDFWLSGGRFKPAYIKKEVAFIKRVLNLPKGAKILDLCCGHGRHVLPLAKAGYQMTGMDLSQKALGLLKAEAKRQKLDIRVVRSDMRKIPFENEFDAVINMFTAFGYLESDQEDFKVLKQITNALKPGGKLLIDIMNKDWILNNFQPKSWTKANKMILLEERIHDPKTSRNLTKTEVIDQKGKSHKFETIVRLHSLSELERKLGKAGLKVIMAYGDTTDGQKFTKSSKRLVIVAAKE